MTQNEFQNPFLKDDQPAVIIPQISAEEADKIIAGLNEQFEEKIMKKLERPAAVMRQEEEKDRKEIDRTDRGANLQDYLEAIKAERPNVPFADEDSNVDLSKLVKRNPHPAAVAAPPLPQAGEGNDE